MLLPKTLCFLTRRFNFFMREVPVLQKAVPQYAPLAKVRRRVKILKFWVFGGGKNIFDIKGELSYEGRGEDCRGLYVVGRGQFILHPFSYFEMQGFETRCNFKKILSIFALSDTRQMQGFKQISTLTLNLNFLFQ